MTPGVHANAASGLTLFCPAPQWSTRLERKWTHLSRPQPGSGQSEGTNVSSIRRVSVRARGLGRPDHEQGRLHRPGAAEHGNQPLPERHRDTHGPARFTGPNNIDSHGASYTATHFLIATGARPRTFNFPGHQHLLDRGGLHRGATPLRSRTASRGIRQDTDSTQASLESATPSTGIGSTPDPGDSLRRRRERGPPPRDPPAG